MSRVAGIATGRRGERLPVVANIVFKIASAQRPTRRRVRTIRCFLYKFPANIVGHASVKAGAASGTGNITLEFCEVYNATLEGTTGGTGCLPFLVPPPGEGSRPESFVERGGRASRKLSVDSARE